MRKGCPVEELSDEETVECQLDLFGQDRIKLGEGYAALARLDLDKAASIFSGLIMENPDFAEAAEGKAMAMEWSDALWQIESLKPEVAAVSLWERIRSSSFGQWGGGLRKALTKKLIALIGSDHDFYAPPDLCLGYLYYELADYELAENSYRRLLNKHPDDSRFLCRLGNSLFLQKRLSEARRCYTRALLMAPGEIDPMTLEDGELRSIIKEVGPFTAPIHGWLRGALQLLDCSEADPENGEHERALLIYRTISLTEEARRKREHREMVEQRRALKEIAPEVFEEYIARLA